METNSTVPRSIDPVSPEQLRIEWKDGVVTTYDARQLRLACPCAQCVEEWTGRQLLQPDRVAADISLRNTDLVGRYGVTFLWSDGHQSGIYTHDHLRSLCCNHDYH